MGISFDKPRSLSADIIARDLRSSPHCNGMQVLLWDKEITVEDTKSGEEISLKVESSRVELNGGKKEFAERLAKALVGAGLRRRAPEGAKKAAAEKAAAEGKKPAPPAKPTPPPKKPKA